MKRACSNEGGFTLIEMLIVVAIIGILANIAIPVVRNNMYKAKAIRVVSDFLKVRRAAFEYYRDHGSYPRDYYPGKEPSELKPYLKGTVAWRYPVKGVLYDWENWVRRDGKPKHRWTKVLYGFSVTTRDRELIDAIRKVYDGPFHYTLGRNYTFVIDPVPPSVRGHGHRW